MWSPLSLPGMTMQYGVRNRSKVWNAYIFSKNPRPTSWQTSMSLPAKISESDRRYEIFQVGNISW